MQKFCVFCGKKPNKKNKEHIIPKWLIKLTGDENRKITLGFNFNEIFKEEPDINLRLFSFKHFQFPACTKCNTKYAALEKDAAAIVKNILNSEYIDSQEINILLDWFDKVRIGLWLGSITLDKIQDEVDPKFFIDNRIGKKDRALYVYKISEKQSGVNFHGFNSPGFQFAPCVCGFRINNFFFISYSRDQLISENLGFPYFEFLDLDENSRAEIFEPKKGSEKFKTPLIKENFFRPTFSFYQSILDLDQTPQEFITDYVKDNLSTFYENRSKIYYYDSIFKKVERLEESTEICLDSTVINHSLEKFNDIIMKNVLEELEKILKSNHYLKATDKKRVENMEHNRKHILKFHKVVKKTFLEQLNKEYSQQ